MADSASSTKRPAEKDPPRPPPSRRHPSPPASPVTIATNNNGSKDVEENGAGDIEEPVDFRTCCKVLYWACRFYGVSMVENPGPWNKACSRVTLFCKSALQVLVLIYACNILVNGLQSESSVLYIIFPVVLATINPIIAYFAIFRKKEDFLALFDAILLKATFAGAKLSDLREKMRRWELKMFAVFFLTYSLSFTAWFLPIMNSSEYEPFHARVSNLDSLGLSSTFILILHWLAIHIRICELISLFVFLAICLGLQVTFAEFIREMSARKARTERGGGGGGVSISLLDDMKTKHKEVCLLVEQTNRIFSPYLLATLLFQVFNVCLWLRSMLFTYVWMTISYHVWVLIFLVVSTISLVLFCHGAVKANEQVLKGIKLMNDFVHEAQNCKLSQLEGQQKSGIYSASPGFLFYITNFNFNPVQITVGNTFAINKNFVATICGTILTYTVALYAM